MAKQDTSVRDIRKRLKEAVAKPVKLTKSAAKLVVFGSGSSYLQKNLPEIKSMKDTNQEYLVDLYKTLKNPKSSIDIALKKFKQSESYVALQQLASDAIDDIKNGNLYDPERIRSYGSERANGNDDFDSFGGFDLNFDENGDFMEGLDDIGNDTTSSTDEYHEDLEDARTTATIEAVGGSAEAIISADNANSDRNLRTSIKHHSQSMAAMENILTTNAATFNAINDGVKALIETTASISDKMLTEVQGIRTTLDELKAIMTPKVSNKNEYKENKNTPFVDGGPFDLKAYIKTIWRNIKTNTGGVIDVFDGGIMGMSVPQLIEYMSNGNPWSIISDIALNKLIPKDLTKHLNDFSRNLNNLIPALLTKAFTKGKDFEDEDGTVKDLIASFFGYRERSRSSIDTAGYKPGDDGRITNKFTKAVEEVIPMWLSRIDSHLSGEPMRIYNYKTGKLELVTDNVVRYSRNAKDLAGNIDATSYMYDLVDRTNLTKENKDQVKDYIYEFIKYNAEKGYFINPYEEDEKRFKERNMPATSGSINKDTMYKMLTGMLRAMPRNELMAMSNNIMDARRNRDQRVHMLNNELNESGMMSIYSGFMDENLVSKLSTRAERGHRLVDKKEIEKIVNKYTANHYDIQDKKHDPRYNPLDLLYDIKGVLQRGLLTFSFDMGNAYPLRDDPLAKVRDNIIKGALNEHGRYTRRIADEERVKVIEERNKEINRQNAMNDDSKMINLSGDLDMDPLLYEDLFRSVDISNPENKRKLSKGERFIADKISDKKTEISDIINKAGEKTGLSKAIQVVKEFSNKPFDMVEKSLQLADGLMFKLLYGEDMLEAAENGETTLVSTFTHMMRVYFLDAKNWFTQHIGTPMQKFFNNLFEKIGNIVIDFSKTHIQPKIKSVKEKVKNKFEEYTGKYDKTTKTYSDGKYSDKLNALKSNVGGTIVGVGETVYHKVSGAVNRFLYGDNVETKGVRYKKYSYYQGNWDWNIQKDGGGKIGLEYTGLIGQLKLGFRNFRLWLFGDEKNNRSHKLWGETVDEAKKAMPGALKGALIGGGATLGMGFLTSLWLPGGPILGAILGSAAGFVGASDKLKKYLFGEDIGEGDDAKHVGGLISKEVQDGFKKYAPRVAGGFAIGALLGNLGVGAGIIPASIAPLVGGYIGSMAGMISASDRMKEALFGKEDDDDSGLFSKNFRESMKSRLPKLLPGGIGGAVLGASAWSLFSSIGLIPGLTLLPGGPIMAAMGGLVGALSSERIIDYLLGKEEVVEVDDGKGGKKKVKKRSGGVFEKIFDFGRDNIVAPFAKTLDRWGKNISKWFDESIVNPFTSAIEPFKQKISDATTKLSDSIGNLGKSISDKFKESIDNAFGFPFKDFVKEHILDPLKNRLQDLFGLLGKVLGSIISAPFRSFAYIATGGKTPAPDEENDDINLFDIFGNFKRDRSRSTEEKKEKKRAVPFERVRSFFRSKFGGSPPSGNSPSSSNGVFTVSPDGTVYPPEVSPNNIYGDTSPFDNLDVESNVVSSNMDDTTSEDNARNKLKQMQKSDDSGDSQSDVPETPEPKNRKTAQEKLKSDKTPDDKTTNSKAPEVPNPNDKVSQPNSLDSGNVLEDNSDTKDEEPSKEKVKERRELATTAKPKDRKVGKLSNNDALNGTLKYVKNIYNEIEGQLGGVGWNIAYIKTILDRQFGKLSPEELPENMEGSRRKVKKHKTIFGRAKDKLFEVLGIPVNFFKNTFETIGNAFTAFTDKLFNIGKFFGALSNGMSSFLGLLWKGTKTVIPAMAKAGWTLIKGFGVGLKEAAKMGLATIKVLGSAAGTAIKGFAVGLANVVAGLGKGLGQVLTGLGKGVGVIVQKTLENIPTFLGALWKGAKTVGKLGIGGLKLAGKGIMGLGAGAIGLGGALVNKIRGVKSGDAVSKSVTIIGGYLTGIKEAVSVKLDDDVTLPFVTLTRFTEQPILEPKRALAVYVAGGHVVTNMDTKKPAVNPDVPVSDVETVVFWPKLRETLENLKVNVQSGKKSDKQDVNDYKRAYDTVDRKSETKDTNTERANVYDKAINSAKSMTEIQAIKDTQQINALIPIANDKNTKKKSKGVLESILSLFSGAKGIKGILSTILGILGGGGLMTAAGSALSGSAIAGAGAAATTTPLISPLGAILPAAATALPGVVGAHNAAKKGEGGHAAVYAARGISSGVSTFIKKAPFSSRTMVKAGQALSSSTGKLASVIERASSKFLSSNAAKVILKKFPNAGPKITTILKTNLDKAIAKLSSSALEVLLKKANIAIMVGTAIYDLSTGMHNAAQYFQVESSDITFGMRVAAGFAKALSGLAFGLIPVSWLSQSLYKLFADEEDEFELKQNQQEYKANVEQFNKENGTNLTVEEYAKNYNDDGTKKQSIGSKSKKTAKKVGKTVLGAAKTMFKHTPLGLATSAIYEHREEIKKKAGKLKDKTIDKAKDIGTSIKKNASHAANNIKGFAGKIGEGVSNWYSDIPGKTLDEKLVGLSAEAISAVVGYFNSIPDHIKEQVESAKKMGESAKKQLGTIKDNITNFFEELPGKAKDGITDFADRIKDGFGSFRDNIVEYFTESLPTWVSNTKKDVEEFFLNATSKVGEFFVSIGEAVGDVVKKSIEAITKLPGKIKDWLTGAKDSVNGWFSNLGKSVSTHVVRPISSKFSKYKSVASVGYRNVYRSTYGNGKGEEDYLGRFGTGNMPYYNQKDTKWNGNNMDLADTGCGPTVAAMVAGKYGANSNPVEASKKSIQMGMRDNDGGTNPAFFAPYANSKGFNMSEGSNDIKSVTRSLTKGNPVVFMGRGGDFGNNMHYMVADRVTGKGKMNLVDPLTGKGHNASITGTLSNTKTTIYSSPKFGTGGIVNTSAITDCDCNGKGTFPATKNGMVYFSQLDDRWADKVYAGGNTFKRAGCVTCSIAMAVSTVVGRTITPPEMAANRGMYNGDLLAWSAMQSILSKKYGIRVIKVNSVSEIFSYVKRGCPVIAHYSGGSQASGSKNYHMIMWARESGGKLYKNDPSHFKQCDTGYSASAVGDRIRWKTVYAFAKADGSGADLSNYTDESGSYSDSGDTGLASTKSGLALLVDNLSNSIDNATPLASLSNGITKISNVVNRWLGNEQEGTSSESTGETSTSDSTGYIPASEVTSDVAKTVWKYFTNAGYSKAATAGIMGNFYQESGMNPKMKQHGGPAAGIAQWESYTGKSGRWASMANYAKSKGKDWTDLASQLEFAERELRTQTDPYFKSKKSMAKAGTVPTTYEAFKNSTDVETATRQFEGAFERAGKPNMNRRLQAAKSYYNAYANGAGPGTENYLNNFNVQDAFGKGASDTNATFNDLTSAVNGINAKINKMLYRDTVDDNINRVTKKVNNLADSASENTDSSAVAAIANALSEMILILKAIRTNTGKPQYVTVEGDNKPSTKFRPTVSYPTTQAEANDTLSSTRDVGTIVIDRLTRK